MTVRDVLLILITCGLGLVQCSTIVCDVCEVDPLPDFQNVRITGSVLWTKTDMASRAECAARCSLFRPIKSFGYKDTSRECVAYTVPLTTLAAMTYSSESGFNMYSTCAPVDGGVSAWGQWTGPACPQTCGTSHTIMKSRNRTCTNPAPDKGGANCTESLSETGDINCGLSECPTTSPNFGTCTSSCPGTNVVCNDGLCVCDIMYIKLGSSCVQGCGSAGYGSGIIVFRNKLLNGYNDRIVQSIQTVEACMNLCLSESGFACVTADYQHESKTCYLSKTPWYNASSSSTVNSTVYHQLIRNCA